MVIVFGILSFLVVTQPALAARAVAVIKGTAEGSTITGQAMLAERNNGLDVEVEVSNVPAGKHGFHIHENGSCNDRGNAAGGHYNPDGVKHGLATKDGLAFAHAGDFGNIEVASDGKGTLKLFLEGLSLSAGKYNVAGKAVILHEKEDDFGQPTGNAGGRIGCGIINVADLPEAPDTATPMNP